MSTTGAIELTISGGGWDGDLVLDETGDLLLSVDTPQGPQATIERITRLVLTIPNLVDKFGNSIGYADDVFHTDWGAGIPAYVDGLFSEQTLQKIATAIRSQLNDDAEIATNPQPIISIQMAGTSSATLTISFDTVSGQHVALPPLNLAPTAVTIGP